MLEAVLSLCLSLSLSLSGFSPTHLRFPVAPLVQIKSTHRGCVAHGFCGALVHSSTSSNSSLFLFFQELLGSLPVTVRPCSTASADLFVLLFVSLFSLFVIMAAYRYLSARETSPITVLFPKKSFKWLSRLAVVSLGLCLFLARLVCCWFRLRAAVLYWFRLIYVIVPERAVCVVCLCVSARMRAVLWKWKLHFKHFTA